ncbi:MAG: cysteine hydrolase [Clostridia bacterium]|nr:cysteine hydrolase [Clostridia bacterium]
MKTLIIIDVQKGFINEHNEQMLENIKKISERGNFDIVIATQFVNDEKSQYIKSLNWNAMFSSPEIDFALNLPKGTFVVQKSSYGLPNSMFVKEGLKINENLVIPKDSEIYLCGTDYDACVLAIAYQLFDNGFAPKIISNAIGSASRKPVDKTIVERIMTRNFGRTSVIYDEDLEKDK